MKLIDADEIRKKAVPHTRGEHGYNADIRKWAVLVGDIDDAPTVDAIVLPCKIGDFVWAIRSYHGIKHPQQGKVIDMHFTNEMKLHIVVSHISRGEWGKTVFATREEAEAAIAERKDYGE
jgi:hypothetical protein